MQSDSRTAHVARIGRSYPRLSASKPGEARPQRRLARRYRVAGAVILTISALGLAGWLLTR